MPEPRESFDVLTCTDQPAREKRIGTELKTLKEQLNKDVTSLLDLPEVKQDQLKRAVKLVHFTKLSQSLQKLYSKIQAKVAETCKCNEDLKTEFRDFVYYGMRAIHHDLGYRVTELESVQSEMTEEEKKDFQRLKMYQVIRQKQVDMLDKLWERLFSPVRSTIICFWNFRVLCKSGEGPCNVLSMEADSHVNTTKPFQYVVLF